MVWKNSPTSIISEISLLEDPLNSKWSCLYRRHIREKSFGIGTSSTILSWRIYRKAWCIYHVIKDYDIIWYAMDLPLIQIKVVVPKFFMYVSTKYKTSFFPVHYQRCELSTFSICKPHLQNNCSPKCIYIPTYYTWYALDYFSLSYRIILHQTCCETWVDSTCVDFLY